MITPRSASVLFDAPGPKARARHRILTIIGAVLALGAVYLIVAKMRDAGQLEPSMWLPFVNDPAVWKDYLLPGIINTLKAAFLSVFFAGIFGLVFGMGRLSEIKVVRWVCGVIVEFFRAVPVLLMMVFAFFGYFAKGTLVPTEYGPLAAVVLALTLYNGSVIAELVRSGVYSLPKGQGEAGLSVGLTPSQVLRSIQLPQALTAMLPALIGQFVVVLKDSALGTAITYQELLTWGKTLGSAYGNTVPAYIIVALIFIALNYAMTSVATAVQRWIARRGTTAGPVTTAQPTLIQGGAEPGEITHTGTDIVREGAQDVRDAAERALDTRRDNRNDPGW